MGALSAPLSVRSNGVPINHKPSMTGGYWTTLTGREHEHGRACAQISTNAVFKLQIFVTQTLVQTPEPKFSPSGPSRWSGGWSRRIERSSSAQRIACDIHWRIICKSARGPSDRFRSQQGAPNKPCSR